MALGVSCQTPFTDNKGVYYHSSEQFLHHQKAIIFNDPMSAANILASKTPGECKSLGGRVKHFEIERWKRQAKDIMQIGLTLKFCQTKLCFKALEVTGKTTLVEASAIDKLWGVGLNLKDIKLSNCQLWQVENWLGTVLENIRQELIE